MAMFHRSKKNSGVRSEMHPHRARFRRLGIESLESRRLLSNNQLDYTIWNLDALKNEYAVISQGTSIADSFAAVPQHTETSTTAGLNVEWVQVPGLYLSPAKANVLAYRHLRSAVASGKFATDELMPLYLQWRDNSGIFSGFDSAPVFAIGILESGFADASYSDSVVGRTNVLHDLPSNAISFGSFDSTANFFTLQSSDGRGNYQLQGSILSGPVDVWSDPGVTSSVSDSDLHTPGDSGFDWNPSPSIDPINIAPVVPTPSEAVANTPADSSSIFNDTVEDLLSEDIIFVAQDDADLVASTDAQTQSIETTLGHDSDSPAIASTFDSASEGGMVSVESIVATVAEGSLPVAPSFTQVAANGEDRGIGGELARVAVMELIEGATEPTAPALGDDTITVLAMNDAAGAVMQFVSTRGGQAGATEWIAGFEYIADQAGGVLAIVLPRDGAQIANMASAAGNLLASVVLPGFSELLSGDDTSETAAGDDARAKFFSELGEEREEVLASLGREHLIWLAAVPVAALLAAERLVAPRKMVPPKSAAPEVVS